MPVYRSSQMKWPRPFAEWPYVGVQWPSFNIESDQADGLVSWVPFCGRQNTDYDVVRGLRWTLGGTPVWGLDDERGWSLLFDDASSEYLSAGFAAVTAPPYTLSCWFNTDVANISEVLISVVDKDVADQRIFLYAHGTTSGDPVGFGRQGGGGTNVVDTTTGFAVDTWHSACAVARAVDDSAVFIDGGSKGTTAASITVVNLDTTAIGMLRDSTPSSPVSGRISDVRIYNRALSDAEVFEHYRNPWELYQLVPRRWAGWSPVAAVAGQPISLRATTVPHLRRWQPGVA